MAGYPTYAGPSIERGQTRTSIRANVGAGITTLFKTHIHPGMHILDYGAGKYARNADWFRERGVHVYAYDPNNFTTSGDGWERGAVSSQLPHERFDVALTAFVLNVVPFYHEKRIIEDCQNLARKSFHVIRADLVYYLKRAFQKQNNPYLMKWFRERFATKQDLKALKKGTLPEERILAFGLFGFQTGKNKFQRIPAIVHGGGKIASDSTWAVYSI